MQKNLTDLLQKNWKGIFNGALSITGTVGSVFAGSVIADLLACSSSCATAV